MRSMTVAKRLMATTLIASQFLTVVATYGQEAPKTIAINSHIPRFDDLVEAYYCRVILDSIPGVISKPKVVAPPVNQRTASGSNVQAQVTGSVQISTNAVPSTAPVAAGATNDVPSLVGASGTATNLAPSSANASIAPTNTAPSSANVIANTNAPAQVQDLVVADTNIVASAEARLNPEKLAEEAKKTESEMPKGLWKDEQSSAIEQGCLNFLENTPKIRNLRAYEIMEFLASSLVGESRLKINLAMASLQEDFLMAEDMYPRAPQIIWQAIAEIYGELNEVLAFDLAEQEQYLRNGKLDLPLQFLYGATIGFSVARGGQLGRQLWQTGRFSLSSLKAAFGRLSAENLKLGARSFGNFVLRAPKRAVIFGFKTAPSAIARGTVRLTVGSISAIRNYDRSYRLSRDFLVKAVPGSYAYVTRSVVNNKWNLAAAAAGGMSLAAWQYFEKRLLKPTDFANESFVAAFDQLYNEWDLIVAVSKATTWEEIDKLCKDVGLVSAEVFPEFHARNYQKLNALYVLTKNRNLNLAFDLVRNDYISAADKYQSLKPKKEAAPAAKTVPPAAAADTKASAANAPQNQPSSDPKGPPAASAPEGAESENSARDRSENGDGDDLPATPNLPRKEVKFEAPKPTPPPPAPVANVKSVEKRPPPSKVVARANSATKVSKSSRKNSNSRNKLKKKSKRSRLHSILKPKRNS